ncbi:MAG: DUF4388 domain-containing protein [Candidatus Krumholzibacteriia bacterium]
MALEGNLSDFGLEEILQLIAVQQKSGFLVLKQDQEMVFYFDRGTLVSTRDRRGPGNDPLVVYLRRYGFFTPEQWTHLDYVLSHATLDLTDVLLSENLLDEPTLTGVLQSVAQEQIHQGMKLKRGSYHFTATSDVASGIRGRISMDIQGLLMEGARRCDEAPRLHERLGSQSLTFARGARAPQPGELGETGTRLLRLALAGRTLGEIIQSARVSAFTTRELLANLCETGALEPVQPELGQVIPLPTGRARGARPGLVLRHPAVTAGLLLLLLAAGAWRWRPLLPVPAGARARAAGAGAAAAAPLRLAQLGDDLAQAITLYHAEHGAYPADLAILATEGFAEPSAVAVLQGRGWNYRVTDRGRSYAFGP